MDIKKTFKRLGIFLTVVILTISAAGCSKQEKEFDPSREIGVISREDGSGTRGAFVELFSIEETQDGKTIDITTPNAVITDKTSVMMTTVADDLYSIGYISLGSLNDTVKAVIIDGVKPSVESIKNKSYKISRSFNLITRKDISDATADFISFIMSKEGKAVIEENKYIPAGEPNDYSKSSAKGKVTVSGSSSITPVMEKLKEAYEKINPDVKIEVQQSDSSTGIMNTVDKTCDIGMASRELKPSEKEMGLVKTVMALDGIAVIINNQNPIDSLLKEQVKNIFTGKTEVWDELS